MSIKGFHHVAIKSVNFKKSLEFYTDVLGLKKVNAWGSGENSAVMLALGDDSRIELFAGGSTIENIDSPIIHIAFNVDDPDFYIEKVRAYGLDVTAEPKDVDVLGTPGFKARIAFCKGIDGEILEFFTTKQ
jgi:catechol 2,3-dioxygenase-like lactoylglutathione lyase family enzyme